MSHTTTAVHLVSEGAYLVKAPYVWNGHVEVDGLRVNAAEFVVQSLEGIELVTKHPSQPTHYAAPTGDTMTVEAYAAERAALLSKSTDDSDDEPQFAALDDEFAYRRFVTTWAAVMGPETVRRQPLTVEVTEVRTESGDPDIASQWNAPSVHADRKLYSLMRNGVAVKTLREGCVRNGLAFEIPGHSGIRFAKIGDGYAFGGDADFGDRPFIGNLAQCKAEKAQIVAMVEKVVEAHAAKARGTKLANAGDVLLGLREIAEKLSGMRAKADHMSRLAAARKHVAELIAQVEATLRTT
jgi:hypothetical protein